MAAGRCLLLQAPLAGKGIHKEAVWVFTRSDPCGREGVSGEGKVPVCLFGFVVRVWWSNHVNEGRLMTDGLTTPRWNG